MPSAFDGLFDAVAGISQEINSTESAVSIRDGVSVIASSLPANISNEERHIETLENGTTRRIRVRTLIFTKSASVPAIFARYTFSIGGTWWHVDEREGFGITETESMIEVSIRRIDDMADRPGRVV